MTENTQTRKFLKMNASPHVHSPITTRLVMLDVIIALIPALAWAIHIFGIRALFLTLVTVAASVIFEFLYRKIMKKSDTIGDLSAVVTGMLLAFSLPVQVPYYMPIIGSFFAIIIVKQLYGGIGKNVVNPALAARVFLFMSFSADLTKYVMPHEVDVVASATPLASLQKGIIPTDSLMDMFIGHVPGCIGEVSASMLILGGIYLLFKKVITWHIPVSFIGTVAILTFVFPAGGIPGFDFMVYELLSGGLLLGAIFMATDYATSPMTKSGRIIYGVGCGLITVFIRYFGYPEGVSFAILIMNLFALAIDKITMPVKFGGGKHVAK